jgi:predicted nucleic acid-binding protein
MSITATELRAGAAALPPGPRRTRIVEHVDPSTGKTFAGDVLPFDADSGTFYAEIHAGRRQAGPPVAARVGAARTKQMATR